MSDDTVTIDGWLCRAQHTNFNCWERNHDRCNDLPDSEDGCDCPCHGRRVSPDWEYVLKCLRYRIRLTNRST